MKPQSPLLASFRAASNAARLLSLAKREKRPNDEVRVLEIAAAEAMKRHREAFAKEYGHRANRD